MSAADQVILYQPPGRPWGAPNLSPFCSKLECYLRMARIPHEVRAANMLKAPKGKVPFALVDGRLMGDSQLILEHLERTRGAPLDGWLSDEQRALGHVVRRMLEEAYYFVGVYLRWGDDSGFAVLSPTFKASMPAPVRALMPLIRRKVRKSLQAQGTGRHSHDEIMNMGKADMTALSRILGDRPFLLGDQPSSYDATVYAFLEGLLCFPYESEVKRCAAALPNLVSYRDRMRARYFST